MCELTNTPVNLDNYYEYDCHIYNKNLVKLGKDGPTLITEDVVTLDAPDTSVNIPLELPNDADIDDWTNDPDHEEELGWDELEDIVTQQITNQNNV